MVARPHEKRDAAHLVGRRDHREVPEVARNAAGNGHAGATRRRGELEPVVGVRAHVRVPGDDWFAVCAGARGKHRAAVRAEPLDARPEALAAVHGGLGVD